MMAPADASDRLLPAGLQPQPPANRPAGKELGMTTKAAFSPEEWKTVLQGPPTAGMIVVTAARGGTIRETIALAKAYSEAHAQPGTAVALVESKATAGELDDYRQFVLALASKVAAAHREHGQPVSPAEAAAIQEIRATVGASTA